MPQTFRYPELTLVSNIRKQSVFVIPSSYVLKHPDVDFSSFDHVDYSISYLTPEGRLITQNPFYDLSIYHYNETYVVVLNDTHVSDYLIRDIKILIKL